MKYEMVWNPQRDITAYELAQCVPFIHSRFQEIAFWDSVDFSIARHFTAAAFDYDAMIAGNAAKLKAALG